jgi:lysophospholipase L1-like esterase
LGQSNAAWREGANVSEVTERSIDLYEEAVLKNREKFRENLEIFVSIVRTLGKRPVLMTQPLGRHSNAQDVFNEIIRSVALRDQVTLIDLDRAIDEIRNVAFLYDEIHLNNKGSQFVGELIASSLAPSIN